MNSQLPGWVNYLLLPILNLLAAFAVSAVVVLLIGENPIEAARVLVGGALGWNEGIGYTLFFTTNFLFTGLAVAVAFHAGLFNIGGEGQAYIAGLGVALIALPLGPILPWYVVFPLAVIGAASFGAAWAFIPAWLRAKRGSHEVITTIMFNFIAASVMKLNMIVVITSPRSCSISSPPR